METKEVIIDLRVVLRVPVKTLVTEDDQGKGRGLMRDGIEFHPAIALISEDGTEVLATDEQLTTRNIAISYYNIMDVQEVKYK